MEEEFKDLGSHYGEEFSGILSPIYEEEEIDRYIHSGFREKAEEYAKKYERFEANERKFASILKQQGIPVGKAEKLTILDVGSGSGNSVIPFLNLFPEAHIIATDMSAELLAILREHLKAIGCLDRCTLIQLNAEELNRLNDSVDIVVGVAVLHHLVHPEKAIAGSAKILKPGGFALFGEPFELGKTLLRSLFGLILQDPRADEIDAGLSKFLRAWLSNHQKRINLDPADPKIFDLEDKWFFSKEFFRQQAEAAGLSSCTFYPVGPGNIRDVLPWQVRVLVKFKDPSLDLPGWAWNIIQTVEDSFSTKMKQDLYAESYVLMTK